VPMRSFAGYRGLDQGAAESCTPKPKEDAIRMEGRIAARFIRR
jgi:hypothetical protein